MSGWLFSPAVQSMGKAVKKPWMPWGADRPPSGVARLADLGLK